MRLFSLFLILSLSSCVQSRPTLKPKSAEKDNSNSLPNNEGKPPVQGAEDEKPLAPDPTDSPDSPISKPDDPSVAPEPVPEAPKPLARKEFQNPVMSSGADPWVVEKDGWYYHCWADGNSSIFIRRARSLSDIEKGETKRIWEAPPGKRYSKETWAPELHFLQGKWYVYFAADDGKDANHRMFVLESENAEAMSNYALKSEIATDFWAIDGTVLEMDGGGLFLMWSGWPVASSKQQNLYIAPMKNPWTLDDRSGFQQKHEAENAQLKNASVLSGKGVRSGKVVGKIDFPDSSVTFTVNVPSAGAYAIEVSAAAGFEGGANHLISANGGEKRKIYYPTMGWENRSLMTARLELKSGENKIALEKGDGYAELDFIVVKTYGKDPVLVSTPTYDWERRGGPPYINEGPQILRKDKRIMSIYSASGSWTDDYCLGQLTLIGNDPMNSPAWDKHNKPVFQSANDVFGPGHASFIRTVDGKEDWIVYHAAKKKGSGWDRNVRIQSFQWNADGSPNFGQPKPLSDKLSFPFRD